MLDVTKEAARESFGDGSFFWVSWEMLLLEPRGSIHANGAGDRQASLLDSSRPDPLRVKTGT
jgi:hypothetical protein